MDDVVLYAIGAVAFIVIWFAFSFKTAAFAGLLFAAAVVPRTVITIVHGSANHSGIASPGVDIHTYSILAVALVLSLGLALLRGSIPIAYMVFAALSVILLIFYWEPSVARVSGVLLFFVGIAAFAGAFGFARAFRQSPRIQQGLALVLFMIALAQAGKSLLQLLSIRSVGTLVSGGEVITRVNGTLGHPGTLGKVLFFLILLALPLTRSATKSVRILSWVTVGLASVTLGLTFGRANIAAAGVLLLAWILFAIKSRVWVRLAVLGAIVVAAVPVLAVVIQRSTFDPFGGSRPKLIPAALEQISREPWFGIGPNSYVSVVSAFDVHTKENLPVHNSFLLLAAELGIVLAALFLIPLVAVVVRAVRSLKREPLVSGYALALLGAVPGIVLTAFTGWGLFAQSILPLVLLCFGFVAGMMKDADDAPKFSVVEANAAVSWRFWRPEFWAWRSSAQRSSARDRDATDADTGAAPPLSA